MNPQASHNDMPFHRVMTGISPPPHAICAPSPTPTNHLDGFGESPLFLKISDGLLPQPPPKSLPFMKHNKTISLRSQGFTLIELLVVIGIIAILATIAVPVGQNVLKKARELQAKAAMKSLEMAVKGYQTEYNRLPSLDSPPPAEDNTEGYDTSAEDGRGIIDILMAADTAKNPRGISFYEPPVAKGNSGYTQAGGLKDIWGAQGYMMIFDYDGDKKITNPYGDTDDNDIPGSVLIYCAGANKEFDMGSTGRTDDLKSWE